MPNENNVGISYDLNLLDARVGLIREADKQLKNQQVISLSSKNRSYLYNDVISALIYIFNSLDYNRAKHLHSSIENLDSDNVTIIIHSTYDDYIIKSTKSIINTINNENKPCEEDNKDDEQCEQPSSENVYNLIPKSASRGIISNTQNKVVITDFDESIQDIELDVLKDLQYVSTDLGNNFTNDEFDELIESLKWHDTNDNLVKKFNQIIECNIRKQFNKCEIIPDSEGHTVLIYLNNGRVYFVKRHRVQYEMDLNAMYDGSFGFMSKEEIDIIKNKLSRLQAELSDYYSNTEIDVLVNKCNTRSKSRSKIKDKTFAKLEKSLDNYFRYLGDGWSGYNTDIYTNKDGAQYFRLNITLSNGKVVFVKRLLKIVDKNNEPN